MTVKDLIARLSKIKDKDKVCIISFDGGWCNIEKIIVEQCQVKIEAEKDPVFSDN